MPDKIEIEVARLTERVDNWLTTTVDYRKELCTKIDKIADKLDLLPCEKRDARYQSINRQVAFMWIVLSAVVLGLLKELFAK